MTFTTAGLAVAGVLAMAIPIIIHLLFRQRRKPLEWAAMRFVLEALRRQKRRLRLEQWLLLASRCAMALVLGLALARPILEAAGALDLGESRTVYLVIDNGLASGLKDAGGTTSLSRHVEQATEIVRALRPGDVAGIITAAQPAKAILAPPSGDLTGVIQRLNEIEPTQTPTDLAAAINILGSALSDTQRRGSQAMVYLLSDFREGSATLSATLPPALKEIGPGVRLLASPAASEPIENIQVASIESVRDVVVAGGVDGSGQMTVRLERTGGALGAGISRVSLRGDDLPRMEDRVVNWSPGQTQATVEFNVVFPRGLERELYLSAGIEPDALEADNQRALVIESRTKLRALVIDRRDFGTERTVDQMRAGQWVRRALEPGEHAPVEVTEVEPAALGPADLRTVDIAVLTRPDLVTETGWPALAKFVDSGGLLLIAPPADVNVHQWTEHMNSDLRVPWRLALEVVNHEEGLALADQQPASEWTRLIASDMPDLARPVLAFKTLPVEVPQGAAPAILQFADGSPMVVATTPGGVQVEPAATEAAGAETTEAAAPSQAPANGDAARRGAIIYMAMAPELSWTNLPSKPLMVPLIQEMCRQGLGMIRQSLRVTAGEQPRVVSRTAVHHLTNVEGARFVLDGNSRATQPLAVAGKYTMHDAAGQMTGVLAVNVRSQAGRSGVQGAAAVSAWLAASGPWESLDAADLTAALREVQAGSPIAGLLLLLLAALVLIEALLARWFSHARRANRGRLASGHAGDLATGIRPTLFATRQAGVAEAGS